MTLTLPATAITFLSTPPQQHCLVHTATLTGHSILGGKEFGMMTSTTRRGMSDVSVLLPVCRRRHPNQQHRCGSRQSWWPCSRPALSPHDVRQKPRKNRPLPTTWGGDVELVWSAWPTLPFSTPFTSVSPNLWKVMLAYHPRAHAAVNGFALILRGVLTQPTGPVPLFCIVLSVL